MSCGGRGKGGKSSTVNMEKTQTYLNFAHNGLKSMTIEQGGALKSAASGAISLGQEWTWRMKIGRQTMSLN